MEIEDFRQLATLQLAGITGLLPVKGTSDNEAAEVVAIRFTVRLSVAGGWKMMRKIS